MNSIKGSDSSVIIDSQNLIPVKILLEVSMNKICLQIENEQRQYGAFADDGIKKYTEIEMAKILHDFVMNNAHLFTQTILECAKALIAEVEKAEKSTA